MAVHCSWRGGFFFETFYLFSLFREILWYYVFVGIRLLEEMWDHVPLQIQTCSVGLGEGLES